MDHRTHRNRSRTDEKRTRRHILILEGQVIVALNGNDTAAAKGTLLPIAIQTPMSIRNDSRENASFLIFKSPHPSEIGS